jgi:hypothetical protein
MNANNESSPGPPFAFIGAQFAVLTSEQILESLARDKSVNAKVNLAAGPLFRLTADNFRDWAKIAEPGAMFQAPEVGLRIIRLIGCPPLATSLSKEAQERMQADKGIQLEPGEGRLRLVLPP